VQQAAKKPRASAAIGEPGAALSAVDFDPVGGGTVVTASADASLRLWSVSAGPDRTPTARELARIDPGVGAIAAVAIDADADTLACSGTDGRVALLRTTAPMTVAKSRDALAAALESRRTSVQDWYAKGGSAGAIAQFDAVRPGQDTATPHALRDLMLLLGPSGAR
jgi:WD40 repeat protein